MTTYYSLRSIKNAYVLQQRVSTIQRFKLFHANMGTPLFTDLHHIIPNTFFDLINKMQERKVLIGIALSRNHSSDPAIQNVLHHLNYMVLPPKAFCRHAANLQKVIHHISSRSEALIFSPEYEFSILFKERVLAKTPHYSLQRLNTGKRYDAHTPFSFCCGSTDRTVIYTRINIKTYIGELQIFLPN